MNNKKPRSSLKKVAPEEGKTVRPLSRRISFSGKKFVREFDTTEKPRDYDNSYEISDHINGSDCSGQSHVTAAAATLQVSTRISLANETKENKPMASVRESISSEYDLQLRSDFTLQLQTSVNMTLMPHELAKNRQRMDLSCSLGLDSLSLSDVEREKLREFSMFKVPVNDKTMDLVPQKMLIHELECERIVNDENHGTIVNPTDMSCVVEKEKLIKQKTVLFENNDITCDFADIDPQPVADPMKTEQEACNSFEIEDRDSMNYLQDSSTSSPIIPLDVISENGISRKLNLRQFMDALNAGSIQPFPNGPRTPLTDKMANSRFRHGLESQSMEEEPLKEAIKPRGTLNFNESMMMSPISQQPPLPNKLTVNHLNEPLGVKKLPNNRFSQADELMLDNTNFLAHAKMGDETQSRNSSKSASRRETTYDNTAMELDDLEKQEAAVTAAIEKATRTRSRLQHIDAMDETSINNVQTSPLDAWDKQRLIRTMQLNESIKEDLQQSDEEPVKLSQTLDMEMSIEAPPTGKKTAIPSIEQEYVIRRPTLRFTEEIVEDMSSPQRDIHFNANSLAPQGARRRQTLHFAEDIEEDIPSPRQDKQPLREPSNQRRQTLHVTEAIDEDIVKPQQESQQLQASQPQHLQTSRRRQTLLLAEAIDEDPLSPCLDLQANKLTATVKQEPSRRRQTLLMAEPIEEDLVRPVDAAAVDKQKSHRRQTVHMAEPIDEEVVKPQPTASVLTKQSNRRRQTVHTAEPMEEEVVKSHCQTAAPQVSRHRQTLLMAEPIEEETIKAQSAVAAVDKQLGRRRQTVHMAEPMEEEVVRPQPAAAAHFATDFDEDLPSIPKDTIVPPLDHQSSRRRQTLVMSESIEEDIVRPAIVPEPEPQSATAAVEKQLNHRRQTVHMAEPIEEEVVKQQPAAHQSNRRRQTLHMAEPIEEEPIKQLSDNKTKPAAAAVVEEYSIRRQTLHFAEDIEEDLQKPREQLQLNSAARPVKDQINRRRQTLHMVESIEEDSFSSHNECTSTQSAAPMESHYKQRQTMHLTEAIDVEPTLATAATRGKLRQTLLTCEQIEEDSSSPAAALQPSQRAKSRPTFHMSEPIEEVSAAPLKKQNYKPRQTFVMSEAIPDEDVSCIELGAASPVPSKLSQTLGMTVAMDEEEYEPLARPTEQSSSKPRMTFLETLDPEFITPTLDECGRESPSDSAEWLAQMNAKMRKTLVNPAKKAIEASKSTMETPKTIKMKHLCFPITPGRSIIEYEDLEQMCNNESLDGTAVDMDIEVSSYGGTPIVVSKRTSSFNIKRLPIHLTPNLPEPKKRIIQQSGKQEDRNNSQLQRMDEDVATPSTRNRSRIPVPCKLLNTNSPCQETEQLDGTVQMVRAQMVRQTRSQFEIGLNQPMEGKLVPEAARIYEDNPITISDVSSHFAAQKEMAKLSLEPKNISGISHSSNEYSNKKYAQAHKKFLNLSGDTEFFDAAEIIDLASDDNDIDKTRLSLVATLLDEEDGIELDADLELELNLTCLKQLDPPAVAGSEDACKKCKHCRRSIDETQFSATDSFVLPDWNALNVAMERLERLRKYPTLDDLDRYEELKELEEDSILNDSSSDEEEVEHMPPLEELIANWNKISEERKKKLPPPMSVQPYANKLNATLLELVPRFKLDYQLQYYRQYIISHKKITTFCILIDYERMDIMETEIRVKNVRAMTTTSIKKAFWGVLDRLLDFQVRLKLPLNLLHLLDGNGIDDIVKLLQHVDNICMETIKLCNDMHLILHSHKARLLRQRKRTVVQKIVRRLVQVKDEFYTRIEKSVFLIEIGNVENISFKDIVRPPLYQFDEKIQFLPQGLAFLDAFLKFPEQYLKPAVEPDN